MPTMELLKLEIYESSNGKHQREYWKAGRILYRLHVYRDHYDFQSFARAEIFSTLTLTWNLLADIPYPMMQSTRLLSHSEPSTLSVAMKQDLRALGTLVGTLLLSVELI